MTSPYFQDRCFIDHHNLRHAYRYCNADGIDAARLRAEVDTMRRNMSEAARLGMSSYNIFTRSWHAFDRFEWLDEELFPAGSPARAAAETLEAAFAEVIAHAADLDLKVIFQSNEFYFPQPVLDRYSADLAGSAAVCPGKPLTWDLFRGKLRHFLRKYPAVAEIQLTTSETQVAVTDCHCPACEHLDDAARLNRFIAEAYAVVVTEMGRKLQVRTWGHLDEPTLYAQATSAMPPDVIVSTKHTARDFHLSSPVNELIGRAACRQVVEFDLWGEYYGWNHFPCYLGHQLAERLRLCADAGVYSVGGRVNWNPPFDKIFDVPFGNQMNVFLFTLLSLDPYQDPDSLLRHWIAETFDTTHTAELERFYRRTYWTQYLSHDFAGQVFNMHSCLTYASGGQEYEARIRRYMGAAAAFAAARPRLLDRRRETLEQAWTDQIDQVRGLDGLMPRDWHHDLLRRAENTRDFALGFNACLKCYAHMAAPGRPPFALEDLEKEIRHIAGRWQARDAAHFEALRGPVMSEIWQEAADKAAGDFQHRPSIIPGW